MKKLVIIGANDFQNQLILKAKSLGYETHVFAWKDGSIGEKTADYFYPISIVEKELILEECKKIKPDGICSIASDLAIIAVNYVGEKLGLPCNGINTVLQCTNKYEMRKKMQANGVKTPKFIKVNGADKFDLTGFKFPLIVKPTDRSGSRGITKVNDISLINDAIEHSTKDSFEKNAIIEEYIEGEEYSCECISVNGKHHFLAFTKKFTTGSPNFIETGHLEPAPLDKKTKAKIIDEVFKALDALEIKNSASHTEFKLDKHGNIGIIEVGARMGGDCIGSDLVYLSTGYDYIKMVIDVATGQDIQINKTSYSRKVGIKFIFNENDLKEFDNYKKENEDKLYRASNFNLNNMGNVVDSSSRIGYYIYFIE